MRFPQAHDLDTIRLIAQRVSDVERRARARVAGLLGASPKNWRGYHAPEVEMALMASGLLGDFIPPSDSLKDEWRALLRDLCDAEDPLKDTKGAQPLPEDALLAVADWSGRSLSDGFSPRKNGDLKELRSAPYDALAWYLTMLTDLADTLVKAKRYPEAAACLRNASLLVEKTCQQTRFVVAPEFSQYLTTARGRALQAQFADAHGDNEPRLFDLVQTTYVRAVGLAQRVLGDVIRELKKDNSAPPELADVLDGTLSALEEYQGYFAQGVANALVGLDSLQLHEDADVSSFGDTIQAALTASAECMLKDLSDAAKNALDKVGDLEALTETLAEKLAARLTPDAAAAHESADGELPEAHPLRRLRDEAIVLRFAWDKDALSEQLDQGGRPVEAREDELAELDYDYALPLYVRLIAEVANRKIPEHSNEPLEFTAEPPVAASVWLSRGLRAARHLLDKPVDSRGLMGGPRAERATGDSSHMYAVIYTAHAQDALSYLFFVLLRHAGVRHALVREHRKTTEQRAKADAFIDAFEQLVQVFLPGGLPAVPAEKGQKEPTQKQKATTSGEASALDELRVLLEFVAYCRHYWFSAGGTKPPAAPMSWLGSSEAFDDVLKATLYMVARSNETVGPASMPSVRPANLRWFVDGLAGKSRPLYPEAGAQGAEEKKPSEEWTAGLCLYFDEEKPIGKKRAMCVRVDRGDGNEGTSADWHPAIAWYVSRWVSVGCEPPRSALHTERVSRSDIESLIK